MAWVALQLIAGDTARCFGQKKLDLKKLGFVEFSGVKQRKVVAAGVVEHPRLL
jgi:hypothetical protein